MVTLRCSYFNNAVLSWSKYRRESRGPSTGAFYTKTIRNFRSIYSFFESEISVTLHCTFFKSVYTITNAYWFSPKADGVAPKRGVLCKKCIFCNHHHHHHHHHQFIKHMSDAHAYVESWKHTNRQKYTDEKVGIKEHTKVCTYKNV